jgi:dTDP-4-dehydrorhamnose reductase
VRILIFGKNGQLGRELHRLVLPLGEVTALDLEDLDLCDLDALRQKIMELKPGVILNAAAYTAVDRAEQEPALAMQVNTHAPRVMAETARELKAALVHFSTDYVFDGCKGSPYLEQDSPNPINAYGVSKLAGEQAVMGVQGAALIFRTSWVYSLHTDGFVTRVLAWSRQQEIMRIVTDQVGSPTWSRLLAQLTVLILASSASDPYAVFLEKRGVYHLAGRGSASRFAWAQAILDADPHREEQVCTRLEAARTADFPTPAARPAFSALDCEKFESAFSLVLPDWLASLNLAMNKK